MSKCTIWYTDIDSNSGSFEASAIVIFGICLCHWFMNYDQAFPSFVLFWWVLCGEFFISFSITHLGEKCEPLVWKYPTWKAFIVSGVRIILITLYMFDVSQTWPVLTNLVYHMVEGNVVFCLVCFRTWLVSRTCRKNMLWWSQMSFHAR